MDLPNGFRRAHDFEPMKARPIPSNYPQFSATIAVRDAKAAIAYYSEVFGAKKRMRLLEPGGKIGHAELVFEKGGLLMLSDSYPEWNVTPDDLGGKSTVVLHLYVESVDATIERAVATGGKLAMPIANHFYGDRSGRVVDPFGHVWLISTHIEDVSPDEMQKRFDEMCAGQ